MSEFVNLADRMAAAVAKSRRLAPELREWCEDLEIEAVSPWSNQAPAQVAVLWEILWRLEPAMNRRMGYSNPHFTNPFLDTRIVGELEVKGLSSDGQRILEKAVRIERSHPLWGKWEEIAREFENAHSTRDRRNENLRFASMESGLEDSQELATRALLRGEPESTVPVLRSYLRVVNSLMVRTNRKRDRVILESRLIPFLGLALERVRLSAQLAVGLAVARELTTLAEDLHDRDARRLVRSFRRAALALPVWGAWHNLHL